MIILLSSSKKQNFDVIDLPLPITQAKYIEQANQQTKKLAQYSIQKLQHVMKMSESLAKQTKQQFVEFSDSKISKAALFAYAGTVYDSFQHLRFSIDQLQFAQDHLRILSGLYGILQPLDGIKPYRLEMKLTKKMWKDQITAELSKKYVIVNLASGESTSVINKEEIPGKWIDVVFLQKKNQVSKTIAVYAKKARGEMAAWLVKNQIQDVQKIKQYHESGYCFMPELSNSDRFVFETVLD